MDRREKIILALVLVAAAILIPFTLIAEYRRTVQKQLKEGVDKIKAYYIPSKLPVADQPPAPPSSPAQPVTYPVSVRSPPSAILQAFNVSGYTDALEASIAAGTYGAEYRTNMLSDPAAWLANHPVLYDHYPAYFAR